MKINGVVKTNISTSILVVVLIFASAAFAQVWTFESVTPSGKAEGVYLVVHSTNTKVCMKPYGINVEFKLAHPNRSIDIFRTNEPACRDLIPGVTTFTATNVDTKAGTIQVHGPIKAGCNYTLRSENIEPTASNCDSGLDQPRCAHLRYFRAQEHFQACSLIWSNQGSSNNYRDNARAVDPIDANDIDTKYFSVAFVTSATGDSSISLSHPAGGSSVRVSDLNLITIPIEASPSERKACGCRSYLDSYGGLRY